LPHFPTLLSRRCGNLFLILLFFNVPSAAAAQQIVGQWTFDEGRGTVAHHSSGRSNEGEIVGANWTSGPAPGSAALAFHHQAGTYPPSSTLTYVRVKNNESLNPIKAFDIAARVYIDPSFSPMFAADILEKGDGYGCSYRLLITSYFQLEAVAGNEHSAQFDETDVRQVVFRESHLRRANIEELRGRKRRCQYGRSNEELE
jgi:hypothetical protein